jgi:hypothetical protein
MNVIGVGLGTGDRAVAAGELVVIGVGTGPADR